VPTRSSVPCSVSRSKTRFIVCGSARILSVGNHHSTIPAAVSMARGCCAKYAVTNSVTFASSSLELCDSGGDSANSHPAMVVVQSSGQSVQMPQPWNEAIKSAQPLAAAKQWVQAHPLSNLLEAPRTPNRLSTQATAAWLSGHTAVGPFTPRNKGCRILDKEQNQSTARRKPATGGRNDFGSSWYFLSSFPRSRRSLPEARAAWLTLPRCSDISRER
jgi:hypothetical protein